MRASSFLIEMCLSKTNNKNGTLSNAIFIIVQVQKLRPNLQGLKGPIEHLGL